MTRTAASPRSAPGHRQPKSFIGGPTAPPLLSQLRSLQVRLPRLPSRQGLSGVLIFGRCEANACSLALHHSYLHWQFIYLNFVNICSGATRRSGSRTSSKTARIALDHTSIAFRLHELEYLLLNLTTLSHQLARYTLFDADVSAYVQSAAVATNFVCPKELTCIFMQYDVLFEEINKYLFP
jgi:hypothetical protein